MIDINTTQVWCRIDLASRRPIAVSDVALADKLGKPVFTVAANHARLDYYIVEEDVNATHGITVRAATAGEITTADTVVADRVAASLAKQKYVKAFALKGLFDETFIRRFRTKGFYTTTETLGAATYSGADAAMVAVKADAVAVNNTYNNWRWNNCKAAIDAMLADAGLGVEVDDEFKATMEDDLDTFLTAAGYDIAVYHR